MSAIFKMAAKTQCKKWAVKIQHCPISSKFDMWVDNDIPTLKNFYRSPFSKWQPQTQIFNIVRYHQNLICGQIMMSRIDSVSYYYYYYSSSSLSPFFPRTMNLSMADLGNYWTEFHETWWSYRYKFLVDPKVFSFVVKGVKVIC